MNFLIGFTLGLLVMFILISAIRNRKSKDYPFWLIEYYNQATGVERTVMLQEKDVKSAMRKFIKERPEWWLIRNVRKLP